MVARKTQLLSHPMHKDVVQLLGWRVCQDERRFGEDEFFLLPFISLSWALVFVLDL
jgi:hypothetical protein